MHGLLGTVKVMQRPNDIKGGQGLPFGEVIVGRTDRHLIMLLATTHYSAWRLEVTNDGACLSRLPHTDNRDEKEAKNEAESSVSMLPASCRHEVKLKCFSEVVGLYARCWAVWNARDIESGVASEMVARKHCGNMQPLQKKSAEGNTCNVLYTQKLPLLREAKCYKGFQLTITGKLK